MRIKILLFCILFFFIVYCGGWWYIRYRIERSNIEHFNRWEREVFYIEEYKVIINKFYKLDYDKYNYQYIDVTYLTDEDGVRFDNMLIEDIEKIKIGDTLMKPKNSYDLFKIKNQKKEKIEYEWKWNNK